MRAFRFAENNRFDPQRCSRLGINAGAAREASLKLLEMTEGRVRTLAETFLGLRHGPMSTVHGDTLIAGFLSSIDQRLLSGLWFHCHTKGSAAVGGRSNRTCCLCPTVPLPLEI